MGLNGSYDSARSNLKEIRNVCKNLHNPIQSLSSLHIILLFVGNNINSCPEETDSRDSLSISRNLINLSEILSVSKADENSGSFVHLLISSVPSNITVTLHLLPK